MTDISNKLLLSQKELDLIVTVIKRHKNVSSAVIFGSRAKGTAKHNSDIDIALAGVEDPLEAESIASELDDLPLPYLFDIKALKTIKNKDLIDHIERVGVRIFG